jgi:hypothetical protein
VSHGVIAVMVVIADDNAGKLAAGTVHNSLPEYVVLHLAVFSFFFSFFREMFCSP